MLDHLDAYFFILLVFYICGAASGAFFADTIRAPLEGSLTVTSVIKNENKGCTYVLNERFRFIQPCDPKVVIGLEVKLVP